MEKLYSINKNPTKEEETQKSQEFKTDLSAKKFLIENLQKRKNFDYNAKNFCASLFCCCCIWCNKTKKLENVLFEKAQNKLHEEMDLLHILKQLRVAAFTSQAFLKPHQSMLVKWFDQYKLKIHADEVLSGKVTEEVAQRESLTLNDVDAMNFRNQSETWQESDEENDEGEHEAVDLLERPKHVTVLQYSELDSIKEFDPINDRVDKLILDKVISDNQTVRRKVLARASFKSPGLVTSLNGDPGE